MQNPLENGGHPLVEQREEMVRKVVENGVKTKGNMLVGKR